MNTTKTLSRITKYVIILLIIFLTGIIIFVNVIDPNKYKDNICSIVSKHTGRTFSIAGNVQWTIFPNLSLYLQDAIIKNNNNFKGDLLNAKEIHIKLKLLPLLQKKFSVKGLELQGIELNLQRNNKGQTNFDDFFKIQNNKNSKKSKKLKNTNATSNTIDTQKNPAKTSNVIKSTAKVSEPTAPKNKSSSSKQPIDNSNSKFDLPNMKFDDFTIKNSKLTFNDQQTNQSFILSNFYLQTKNLDLRSKKDLSPITISGNIKNTKENFSRNFAFKTNLIANLENEEINLDPFELEFFGVKTKANIKIKSFSKNCNVTGDLELLPFDPSDILKFLNVKIDKKNQNLLPKTIKGKTKISLKDNLLSLNSIFLDVDKGRVAGNINFNTNTQKDFSFDITSDSMNIQNLCFLCGSIAIPATKTNTKETKTNDSFNLSFLKGLNIKGKLNATNIIINKSTKIDLFSFNATGNNNIIQLQPINLDLFDSKHDLSLKIDLNSKDPIINLTTKSNDFDIEKLLKGFGYNKIITGKTNISADLSLKGNSISDYKKSLSGSSKLQIKNGFFYGINLSELIAHATKTAKELYNLIKNKDKTSIPNLLTKNYKKFDFTPKKTDKTSFSIFSASTKIKNGIINNNDLLISDKNYNVSGRGTVNLPNNSIQYTAELKLLEIPSDEKNKINDLLKKHPIEIRISENIDDPKIKPNTKKFINSILKDSQKSAVRKITERAIEKVIGKKKINLKKILKKDESKNPQKTNSINQLLDMLKK